MDADADRKHVDLDALASLERAATPGPWEARAAMLAHDSAIGMQFPAHVWAVSNDERGRVTKTPVVPEAGSTAIANLIAANRNALPDLIAELRFRREGMRVTEETARRADALIAAAEKVVEAARRFGDYGFVVHHDAAGTAARRGLYEALAEWDRAKGTT